MKKAFLPLLLAALLVACGEQKTDDATMVKTATAEPSATNAKHIPAEFADMKYADYGRKMIAAMEQGKIEEWGNLYADDARYYWSGGDSLVGKKAILDYWTKRRAEVVESISFSNDIWTPLKVNQPQKGPDLPGVWLLSWYQVKVSYKNGKQPIQFWVHTDHHFDANDKIDRTIQYIDRLPIEKAMSGK